MSALWSLFLELFQAGLFTLTQFYGGQLGAAIVSFSLLVRLALLPLSVRMAVRARRSARELRRLAPRVERDEWADNPTRLAEETLALYRAHGVSPLGGGVIRGALVQSPVLIGVYHAVRSATSDLGVGQGFLWIVNLARPDVGLALLASLVAFGGAWVGASAGQSPRMLWIPVAITGTMALVLSSGFALYLLSGGVIQVLQGLIVRRLESGAASVQTAT